MFQSIYPYDGSVVAEYPAHSPGQVNEALQRATRAFADWRRRPLAERAGYLRRAGEVLRARRDEWARLITLEMGKSLNEARAEIEKCAGCCAHYAEYGPALLEPQRYALEGVRQSYVRFDPLGAVLAVMPWNFPFWQAVRFAVPTLLAGNVGLLKHASNVSGCALALEAAFREAGVPEGVFQTLLVDTEAVGKLIEAPEIRAVTLTGSEKAGMSVAARAGGVLKKTVLELGGSDPFVVLADADLARAAEVALQSRLQNAGQSCIAAKRFIVVAEVHDAFVEALHAGLSAYQPGDPLQNETRIGTLARPDLADAVLRQLEKSVEQGATKITGGTRDGCLVTPALLTNVRPGQAAFDEETFGPVIAVTRARDEAQAIALANQSDFGLGAALWTRDLDRAEVLAAEIESGSVFINSLVRSTYTLPFGGVKRSGYGRELSDFGIREFVNVKTVGDGVDAAASFSPVKSPAAPPAETYCSAPRRCRRCAWSTRRPSR
jgi:succinate-semialdehyde dehydrogenase/glutarate-semialdehyde dehydrogenase